MNKPKPEADRYMMPDEWQRLKEIIPNDLPNDRLIFWETILYGGLRISEALLIVPADIDKDHIRIKTLKQKELKIDRVFYPEDFIEKLKKYIIIKKIKKNSRIFTTTVRAKQKEFKKYCKIAKLNARYSPHSLRHLHGILVADVTRDPIKVAAALRHRKIETAYKYIHIAPSVRKEINQSVVEKLKEGGNDGR